MKVWICLVALCAAVCMAADCTNNKCQNGGVCTTPRLYTAMAVGEYMIYALSNGRLYTFGEQYGAIAGTGKNPLQSNTVQQVNISNDVTVIDAKGGLHHTVALDSDGHVWAWGSSFDGKADGLQGMGPNYFQEGVPTKILADSHGTPFNNIVAIAAGGTLNVALNSSGTVFVWGDVQGALAGDGNVSEADRFFYYPTPVTIGVQVPGTKIIKIAAGGSQIIMALGDDGTVYSWGGVLDTLYNLGWGITDVPQNTGKPGIVKLPKPPQARVVGIYCGISFNYALTQDGTLYGWGFRGQYLGLGDGTGTWYPTTTPVNLTSYHKFPHPVRQVTTGQSHTVVILTDGTLWAWGYQDVGQVGNGKMNSTNYAPIAEKISPDNDWYDIYSTPNTAWYTFAQKNDGRLYSWGRNKYGVLGNGVMADLTQTWYNGDFNVPVPTQVDPLNLGITFSQTAYTCVVNHSAPNCNYASSIPQDFCHPSHCPTGTTCNLVNGGYRFVCDCSSVPTLTGITCNITKAAKIPSSGYSCQCPSGFGGQYCTDVRPADLNAPPTTPAPTPRPTPAPSTPAPTPAPSTPAPTPRPPTPAPTPTPTTSCPTCQAPITGSGTGLRGFYFSDPNLMQVVGAHLDPTINFNWGSGAPAGIAPNFPTDNFSVRWRGTILPQYTGYHTFTGTSDDGQRLYIGGNIVIDNWVSHAATAVSGTIYLQAGISYPIVYEYYEGSFDASVSLSWSINSACSCLPQQIIPTSQLTPASFTLC